MIRIWELLYYPLLKRYAFLRRSTYKSRLRKVFTPDTVIISNNCFGSRISKDLGYRYNSPTIGLYIRYPDCIVFAKYLQEALTAEITITMNPEVAYPVGHIKLSSGDFIRIDFIHYNTLEEAYSRWNRRCKRVNTNDIIFLFTDSNTDSCLDYRYVYDFLDLKVKRKCIFTKKDFEIEHNSYRYVPGMKKRSFLNSYDSAHIIYKHLCQVFK